MADGRDRVTVDVQFGCAVTRPCLVASVHEYPSEPTSVAGHAVSILRGAIYGGAVAAVIAVGLVAAAKDPVSFAIGFAIGSAAARR